MQKTNAQRQAEWRRRRNEELHSLRNAQSHDGNTISGLTIDEFNHLNQQLAVYRTKQLVDHPPAMTKGRALDALMRMKLESERVIPDKKPPVTVKVKSIQTLNLDLFDSKTDD